MRAAVIVLTIFALAAVLCGPTCAAVDLLNGSEQQGELQIGFYHPTGTGNMDDVREYDGRTLNFSSLEYLSSLGYSGPWQYHVLGRYLFAHDIDAAAGISYKNRFGLSYYNSTLTHRLEAVRAGNIALVAATPGVDDSPTQEMAIVRTVNDIRLRFVPDNDQAFRVIANAWLQSKDGTRQQLGRWNDPDSATTGNRKRARGLPIQTDTSQGTVGADWRLGQTGVINYRYSNTTYSEGGSGITTIPILANLTRLDSDTKTSTVKARASIKDRLFFTGVHTNRKRVNTRATFVEFEPAGVSINSTTAALTYLATDSLTLTARYRTVNQDSSTIPILNSGLIINSSLSTKLKSSLFEATYSGIPRAFMRLGYERKDVSRSNHFTGEAYAEMEESSKANIITGSIRYYPTTSLSISANAYLNNTDTAGYAGTADDRKQLNANATYMIRDNMALYGDVSRLDERNTLIRVPYASIPATGEEPRIEAAGQGYDNEMTTGTLGAWYAFNSKLVADANYSNIKTDASNLWVLGLDATTAASNTVPNTVSFNTQNTQWSAGLTYSLTPKWSFYGRYLLSNSDGRALLNSALYPPGVGPTWLPVDVRQHTYVLGFSHDLTAKDRLHLDFSASEYVDLLNSANTGTYDIWRVGWSRQF